ncbi:MAG: DUF4189 domain-containing protein [Magnetococcales bacterium]|nr:DUF4189 domain-containing protein [Magnetococcales bacterium]
MQKTVLFIFLSWLLLPTDAFAYGAIALDDQPGDEDPAYGFSINEDSKASAKASALRYCREYGGTNCRIIVWFETCGAVAISRKYRGYGYGRHKQKAIDDALDMCGSKRCEIVAAECES